MLMCVRVISCIIVRAQQITIKLMGVAILYAKRNYGMLLSQFFSDTCTNRYVRCTVNLPDRQLSKTLLTIDERGSKIAGNSVFDCNLSPDWRQMAIENWRQTAIETGDKWHPII